MDPNRLMLGFPAEKGFQHSLDRILNVANGPSHALQKCANCLRYKPYVVILDGLEQGMLQRRYISSHDYLFANCVAELARRCKNTCNKTKPQMRIDNWV